MSLAPKSIVNLIINITNILRADSFRVQMEWIIGFFSDTALAYNNSIKKIALNNNNKKAFILCVITFSFLIHSLAMLMVFP